MNEAPSNRLRELREHKGMSRAAVAAHVGVGEQQVRRWEDNDLLIPTKYLASLIGLFEVTADYLLGLDCSSATPEASAA
jgi:repressor LexA